MQDSSRKFTTTANIQFISKKSLIYREQFCKMLADFSTKKIYLLCYYYYYYTLFFTYSNIHNYTLLYKQLLTLNTLAHY